MVRSVVLGGYCLMYLLQLFLAVEQAVATAAAAADIAMITILISGPHAVLVAIYGCL